MLRPLARTVGITGATVLMAFAGSGIPTAVASGQDYGQHVRMCAQDVGFDGSHNPGMHTGISDWDRTHAC